MIGVIHAGLTSEKWNGMPMEKRLLNIVSELTRTMGWAGQNQHDFLINSMEGALELMDLTTDGWNKERPSSWLKEYLRIRSVLAFYYNEARREGARCAVDPANIRKLIQACLELEPVCHNLGLEF